jgi:hypothetical protein
VIPAQQIVPCDPDVPLARVQRLDGHDASEWTVEGRRFLASFDSPPRESDATTADPFYKPQDLRDLCAALALIVGDPRRPTTDRASARSGFVLLGSNL